MFPFLYKVGSVEEAIFLTEMRILFILSFDRNIDEKGENSTFQAYAKATFQVNWTFFFLEDEAFEINPFLPCCGLQLIHVQPWLSFWHNSPMALQQAVRSTLQVADFKGKCWETHCNY